MGSGRDQDDLFFIHVMKTAGTSFTDIMNGHYPDAERYPNPDLGLEEFAAYQNVSTLASVAPEDHDRIRSYAGHFPYYAIEAVGFSGTTATILREPVARTVSYLKQCQRTPTHRGQSLEEIYDNPWHRAIALDNYQTKIFAMEPSDGDSVMHGVAIDDDRLAQAKENLARMDLVGFTYRFGDFVTRISGRMGWRRPKLLPTRRVSAHVDVPPSLELRIIEDNPYEIEFFEHAKRAENAVIAA